MDPIYPPQPLVVVVVVAAAAVRDIPHAHTQGPHRTREGERPLQLDRRAPTQKQERSKEGLEPENSIHLFNIFSRPTDTCSVMCCFSVNSSITMLTYIHTCVGAREENPTPFHWAVALSRGTAANVIVVSMRNGRLIS